MNQQADLFTQLPITVMDIARANCEQFKPDFIPWLEKNLHIWERFCKHAFNLIQRGRSHYSARTIIEVMRHETALAEAGTPVYKISNVRSPYLARLFALAWPQHADLFSYREVDTEKDMDA